MYSISVYSYENVKLVDLKISDISLLGQAYNETLDIDISGSKSLNFILPLYYIDKSTGKLTENFRWNYIKCEYLVKYTEDLFEDWFIIKNLSEEHSDNGVLLSNVQCQHISSQLSQSGFDKSINMTGMADEILNEVLRDSGWSIGTVDNFTQYNTATGTYVSKVRTINANRSNIYELIQEICEKFECYPVFNASDRTVDLKLNVGSDNGVVFRYTKNLKNIARAVDSTNIITKMWVEGGTDEVGLVTISNVNPTKCNYLLDFSYFDNSGMLTQAQRDAITTYSTAITQININLQTVFSQITLSEATKMSKKADLDMKKVILATKNQSKSEIEAKIQITRDSAELAGLQAQLDTLNNEIALLQLDINILNQDIADLDASLAPYYSNLDGYNTQKKSIEQTFRASLNDFIREGLWQDSNYIDAEKLYIDAQEVIKKVSQPKISYTANIVDLSTLSGYELDKFNIGDTIKVYDELLKLDTICKITKLVRPLGKRQETTIEVANFKSDFEDLFSRISKSADLIERRSQVYERAVGFTPDGRIDFDVLQASFDANKFKIINGTNNTVEWGVDGITITDLVDANKKVRINSGGIFLSKDNGVTWKVGMSADGISAMNVVSGVLDTKVLNIYNSSEPLFHWDKNGLFAMHPTDTNQWIVYNKDGIYFTKDNGVTASVALTFSGLVIRNGKIEGNKVLLDTDAGTFRLGISDTDYSMYFDGTDLKFGQGVIRWDNLDTETQSNLMAYSIDLVTDNGQIFKFNSYNANVGILYTTITCTTINITSPVFSWSKLVNGETVNLPNTTESIVVESSSLTDISSVTYRCTVTGLVGSEYISISDNITIIKVMDGSSAYHMYLTSSGNIFSTDTNGVVTPSSITITANLINYDESPTPTFTWYEDGIELTGQIFSTLTVDSFLERQHIYKCIVTNGKSSGIYTEPMMDETTLVRVEDGLSGEDGTSPYAVFLTNESVIIPADGNGVATNFDGATTLFKVYHGTQDVTKDYAMYLKGKSDTSITLSPAISTTYGSTTGVSIVSVGNDVINGYIDIDIKSASDSVAPTVTSIIKPSESLLIGTVLIGQDYSSSGASMITPSDSLLIGTVNIGHIVEIPDNSIRQVKTNSSLIVGTFMVGQEINITPLSPVIATLRFNFTKAKQGVDGYSVLLTNESINLPCDANGSITSFQGASTDVLLYKGATQVSASIGTPVTSGCTVVSPIVQKNVNGIIVSTIEINSVSADSGYVDIPVYYNSVLIATKRFNFAKARQGATFRNRGTWNNATEYVNNSQFIDIVVYEGNTYSCKATNINQLPTNTTYWTLLVANNSSLLDWVADWDSNRTVIGSESIVSPKIFAGSKNVTTGYVTGIVIGRDVLGNGRTGIAGYYNQPIDSTAVPNFSLNADGTLTLGKLANDQINVGTDGKVTFGSNVSLSWGNISGTPNTTYIDANGVYTGKIKTNQLTSYGGNPIIRLFQDLTVTNGGDPAIDATENFLTGIGSEIRLKWNDANYIMVGTNYFYIFQEGYQGSLFGVTPDGVTYKGQPIGVGNAIAVLG